MENFPGPQWITPSTLSIQTVASTAFARFEVHTVKTESGSIINDWLWTDERSHVNILVHLKHEDKYLLFYQKKYGLEKPYLAVVGGLFNVGETAIECATRELLEETGLETKEMISLGRYRVQVNRGGGILYTYFARNCFLSPNKKLSDDYEKQEVRKLSRDELIKATLAGEVGEAQWVAAVALGLLYEEHRDISRTPMS
jgi:ADP-ribose pyrophosphatase YjhB (NUDIX family)